MDNRKVDLSEVGAQNEAIYAILIKILEKWRGKIEVEEKKLEETVIVSPQTITNDAYSSPAVKPKDKGLKEMVSLEDTDGMSSKERAEKTPVGNKELEETIIVSPQAGTSDAIPSPAVKPKDVGLEETIVSMKEAGRLSSKQRLEEQPKEEDEFLEETILLKPKKG